MNDRPCGDSCALGETINLHRVFFFSIVLSWPGKELPYVEPPHAGCFWQTVCGRDLMVFILMSSILPTTRPFYTDIFVSCGACAEFSSDAALLTAISYCVS